MNKKLMNDALLLALLSALTVVGSAQGRGGSPWGQRPGGPPPDQRGGPPPDRPDFGRGGPGGPAGPGGPSFEMFSDNRLVKGAPYSATAVTETVQTLGDGARVSRKNTDTVYRDGEGRTRREQTIDHAGPFSVGDQARQVVLINDPVTGVSYFLDAQNKTARKMTRPERPAPNFRPPPPNGEARRPAERNTAERHTDERKVESLGKQLFDGVEAEGTRVTITIPVGRIGNDRPLETISERWESAALQVVVFSRHKDPFAGETTYRLTDIKRAEPPHSLFEAPADYTVEEGRPSSPPPPGADARRRPPQDKQ